MIPADKLLSYLHDVCLAGGLNKAPDASGAQWTLTFDELCTGGLSTHITRDICLRYSLMHEESAFGERDIPLVCCVRTLGFADGSADFPALLIRATLKASGDLEPAPRPYVWIPAELIASDELYNSSIALCDLDTYLAHDAALASLPLDGTWENALERAVDFFDAVCTVDDDDLERLGMTLETNTCTIQIWEHPCDHGAAARTLESQQAVLGSLAGALLDGEGHAGSTSAAPSDDVLLPHKVLCGIPDSLIPLEQRDQEVLSSIALRSGEGVLCLRAPAGTSGTVVAMAAMANLYTSCALRGEKAPTMRYVASASELARFVGLLSSRPTSGQVALSSRWLPRISSTTSGDTSAARDKRILGPLGALCIVRTSDGVSTDALGPCLTQPLGHPRGGDVALYADPWYTPKATIYFLDCVSGFFHTRVRSLGEARQLLSDRLHCIDRVRQELIEAYSNVCKANELLRQRDNLVARIGRLRRAHTACRNRLAFWEEILRNNPVRKPLFGKAEPDQSALIAQNAQRGEDLTQDKKLVQDVCGAYREELARLENSIDRLRGASTNLAKRIQAAEPAGETCAQAIERLSGLCSLTIEQTSMLETSLDGRTHEVSLVVLNKALDQTIRPAEFWLALHLYESHWLEINQHGNALVRTNEAPELTPGTWATLCPFELVPAQICVSTAYEESSAAQEACDLAIVAEGHMLDLGRGLALCSYARRMLVMGTTGTIGAEPLRYRTFDEISTSAYGDPEMWAKLNEYGASASSGASLFGWTLRCAGDDVLGLTDTRLTYGELDDLRSDLVPAEPLRSNRVPANSADDNEFALAGVLPSLSYVTVPDSAWKPQGPSRANQAEAMALGRWLERHLAEVMACYERVQDAPVAVICPYASQVRAVRTVLDASPAIAAYAERIDVLTLGEVENGQWPMVVFCATCGPSAYESDGPRSLRTTINMSLSCATDAYLLVCGTSWENTTNEVAAQVLSHMTQVGRLFSKPRRRRKA